MLRYTEQVVIHVQKNMVSNDMNCINKPRASVASFLLTEWDNLSSAWTTQENRFLGCWTPTYLQTHRVRVCCGIASTRSLATFSFSVLIEEHCVAYGRNCLECIDDLQQSKGLGDSVDVLSQINQHQVKTVSVTVDVRTRILVTDQFLYTV